MVCSGYSDFLACTLPHNRPLFERLTIVTTEDDSRTAELAKAYDAELVVSERKHFGGAIFNKGAMLNDGLRVLGSDRWVVVMDADIIVPEDTMRLLKRRTLRADCLYYLTRLNMPEERTLPWMEEYAQNRSLIKELSFSEPGANRMPWGYFQLFNLAGSSKHFSNPDAIYPQDFVGAGDVDYSFQALWPRDRKVLLPEAIIHIPHGTEGTNWLGRQSPIIDQSPAVALT